MGEYPGLTEERVKGMIEDGFQPEQIAKCNKRELDMLDEKLRKYTTTFEIVPWKGRELRLVLLGKTGSGKSSVANLLTGSTSFKECHGCESCTQTMQEESAVTDGIKVRVIDTPGFDDTKRNPNEIITEIVKVLDTFHNGIHGFLFVFNSANFRFTPDQGEMFCRLEEVFGESVFKCCLVVMSHGDEIVQHGSLSDYLQREKTNPFGKLLLETLQKRVIAVESSSQLVRYSREKQQQQVVRFICSTNCAVYTNQDQQEHRQATRDKVAASVREFVPFVEDELSTLLQDMSHDEICKLSDEDEKAIIVKVLQNVDKKAQDKGRAFTQDELIMLQEGVKTVLGEKKERLTSDSFLSKLKDFVVPLLGATGVAITIKNAFAILR